MYLVTEAECRGRVPGARKGRVLKRGTGASHSTSEDCMWHCIKPYWNIM